MSRKAVEKNIAYDDIKKRYYVTFDFGINEAGKQIKKTKTFEKISEARKALKEHEANRTKGLLVMPKQTTLLEWLNYWIEEVVKPNRAETTVYGYRRIIEKHIEPDLGNIPLQQLKPQQVQRYYTKLMNEKGLSSNTVRKHHDMLRTALELAVKQDVLLKNTMDKVEAPKVRQTEINFYTLDDLKKLIDAVEGDRLEIVVKLAAYLGLRREEICGLKWDCVDLENNIIVIKNVLTMAGGTKITKETKNKSSQRVISIPDEVAAVLRKVRDRQGEDKEFFKGEYIDSGYVVAWPNGKEYRPNYISELFTKFIKDHHLPKITLHGLRHTFATIANSLDLSQYEISKALGHSSPSTTTKVYTHLFDKTQKEAFQKIAEHLKK